MLWLAFALLLVLWVALYGFFPVQRWRLRAIPGPPGNWLFGHMLKMVRKHSFYYYSELSHHYKIFKVFLGAKPVVVVADAEVGKKVNTRCPMRPELLGPGLLLTPEDNILFERGILTVQDRAYHRSLRTAWQPAFLQKTLDNNAAQMNAGVEHLQAVLARAAQTEEEVNLHAVLGRMTMEVVGTTAFGRALPRARVEFRTQDGAQMDPEVKSLMEAAETVFRVSDAAASAFMLPIVCFPFLTPAMRIVANLFPDAGMRQVITAQRVLIKTCQDLLDRSRTSNPSNGARPAAPPGAVPSDVPDARMAGAPAKRAALAPGSFMKYMSEQSHSSGKRLTDVEAMAQANIFLLAGYDTTASALASTCYLLSANPDKQAKLLQEVDAFGGGSVALGDLAEGFPYVSACFREALRLYPPGHITVREANEDLELRGMRVPKGTEIHVAVCAIQRDPDVWRQPEAFVPERWIDGAAEAANEVERSAWMAFGDGARSCIGKRFAEVEAKIAIIRLFQRFTFTLSPGQVPLQMSSFFTLSPKAGVFVTPRLRAVNVP